MTCTLVDGILVKKRESLSLYMCSAYSALEEGEAKWNDPFLVNYNDWAMVGHFNSLSLYTVNFFIFIVDDNGII
jgi:hypothetical protein